MGIILQLVSLQLQSPLMTSSAYTVTRTIARRKHEETINAFPHFIATVDDQDRQVCLHFVALFSRNPAATNTVFLHGWPVRPLSSPQYPPKLTYTSTSTGKFPRIHSNPHSSHSEVYSRHSSLQHHRPLSTWFWIFYGPTSGQRFWC